MSMRRISLCCAAILSSGVGAYAADAAVLPEPEPMEYVRRCPMDDTDGFFYIPGTETCLRIGGYLRYDIGVGFLGLEDVIDKSDFEAGRFDESDTYYKRARATMQFDARSETEYGTLRGYSHVNIQYTSVVADGFTTTVNGVDMEHAFVEIGGLRVGKSDSVFVSITNFAGNVIQDDLIDYEPDRTQQIVYTFTGPNGFQAAIGLEEGAGGNIDTDGDGDVDIFNGYVIDSYMPHVVAGVSYDPGRFGVSAAVGYDSVWEEWAAKLRFDYQATDAVSLFILGGYSSTDDGSYYGTWDGNWAVWTGGTVELTERLAANFQLSYDDSEAFAAVANVNFEVVPGLMITPEVDYFDSDLGEGGGDNFGGFLRIQRSF